MVRSAEVAARRAEAKHTNRTGTCQLVTRGYFDAPSAGDLDHDGDADAIDGWLSEPKSARHLGDRHPPRGAPTAWSGGRHGFGHRALSLGNVKIRSTDAPRSTVTSTVDLDWVERNWGLHYLGWTSTIDGVPIPGLGKPPEKDDPDISLVRVIKATKAGKAIIRGKLLKISVAREVGRGNMMLDTGTLGPEFLAQYIKVQKEYLRVQHLSVTKSATDGIPGLESLTWLGKRHGFDVVA